MCLAGNYKISQRGLRIGNYETAFGKSAVHRVVHLVSVHHKSLQLQFPNLFDASRTTNTKPAIPTENTAIRTQRSPTASTSRVGIQPIACAGP